MEITFVVKEKGDLLEVKKMVDRMLGVCEGAKEAEPEKAPAPEKKPASKAEKKPVKKEEPKPEPKEEPEGLDDLFDGDEKEEPENQEKFTIDDCKVALTEYANKHSKPAALAIIKKHCASGRLADMDESEYAFLIADLSA